MKYRIQNAEMMAQFDLKIVDALQHAREARRLTSEHEEVMDWNHRIRTLCACLPGVEYEDE